MATIRYNPDDPQQFALYDAEALFAEDSRILHYRDVGEVRDFVKTVIASPVWESLLGAKKIAIRVTRHDSGIATCMAGKGQINLPGWAFNQKTILHEMAHLVSNDGHGPDFARAALTLYSAFIGKDFASNMQSAYERHDVKIAQDEREVSRDEMLRAAEAFSALGAKFLKKG